MAEPSKVDADDKNSRRIMRRGSLKDEVAKLPKEVRNIVAGGIAGMVAKTVVAPLERIKILYQVSAEKFMLRQVPVVALHIIQREGFTALWRGNTATMLRVFPYSGIQFMVFDGCKTYLLKEHERLDKIKMKGRNAEERLKHFGLSPLESLLSGMTAGAVSVCVSSLSTRMNLKMSQPPPDSSLSSFLQCTYPLDLTRAQLALHRSHPHSKSIGFITVIRNNFGRGGFRGLFRGLSPTILGILPYSGIAFALNEQGKRKVSHYKYCYPCSSSRFLL